MERRRYARFLVCVEIEIKAAGRSYPLRSNTTDISLGGCYVATIFPLATGTALDFTLWFDGETIEGKGSVQTCHSGVGMGIKFTYLADEALRRLDHYLHASAPALQEERVQSYIR